ncbi:uncharacterized protein LOC135928544 [Gordionus sp. m RMFG-2023]|uniref:uncharacterized protein LOC135928544 n=1 Tax=Gordionus sp. m RMFG-2023 TaxID=3053472 RepID=UPI0031FDF2BB
MGISQIVESPNKSKHNEYERCENNEEEYQKKTDELENTSKNNGFFGNALSNLEYTIVDDLGTSVPKILHNLGIMIEKNLEVEGLFRKSGSCPRQTQVQKFIDKNLHLPSNINFNVFDACCLFKLFFSKLPEPIFPTHLWAPFVQAYRTSKDTTEGNGQERIEALLALFLLLPYQNINILRYTFILLSKVNLKSHLNKMAADNLATLMTPNFLHDIISLSWKEFVPWIKIITIFINHSERLGWVPHCIYRLLPIKDGELGDTENNSQTGPIQSLSQSTDSYLNMDTTTTVTHVKIRTNPYCNPSSSHKTPKHQSSVTMFKRRENGNTSEKRENNIYCGYSGKGNVNFANSSGKKKHRRSGSLVNGLKHGFKKCVVKPYNPPYPSKIVYCDKEIKADTNRGSVRNFSVDKSQITKNGMMNKDSCKSPSVPNLTNENMEYNDATSDFESPFSQNSSARNKSLRQKFCKISSLSEEVLAKSSDSTLNNKYSTKHLYNSTQKLKNAESGDKYPRSKHNKRLIPKGVTGVRKLFFKLASLDKNRPSSSQNGLNVLTENSLNTTNNISSQIGAQHVTSSLKPEMTEVEHKVAKSTENNYERSYNEDFEIPIDNKPVDNEKIDPDVSSFVNMSRFDFSQLKSPPPKEKRGPLSRLNSNNLSKCNLVRQLKRFDNKDFTFSALYNYYDRKSLSCSQLPGFNALSKVSRKGQEAPMLERGPSFEDYKKPGHFEHKYSIDSIISDSLEDEYDQHPHESQTNLELQEAKNKYFISGSIEDTTKISPNSQIFAPESMITYNSPSPASIAARGLLKLSLNTLNKDQNINENLDQNLILSKLPQLTRLNQGSAIKVKRSGSSNLHNNKRKKPNLLRGRPNSLRNGLNTYREKLESLGNIENNLDNSNKMNITLENNKEVNIGTKNEFSFPFFRDTECPKENLGDAVNTDTPKKRPKLSKLNQNGGSQQSANFGQNNFAKEGNISRVPISKISAESINDSIDAKSNSIASSDRYSLRSNPHRTVSEQIKRYNQMIKLNEALKCKEAKRAELVKGHDIDKLRRTGQNSDITSKLSEFVNSDNMDIVDIGDHQLTKTRNMGIADELPKYSVFKGKLQLKAIDSNVSNTKRILSPCLSSLALVSTQKQKFSALDRKKFGHHP